jgi:hypothetical protein
MYFCYLDESGNAEPSGNSAHFVLLGFAIPVHTWHAKDSAIAALKARYRIPDAEIHTAYLAQPYKEQERIPGFAAMDDASRIAAMTAARELVLITHAATKNPKVLKNQKKNYIQSSAYIHLTHAERLALLRDFADLIGSWTDARIFAEAAELRRVTHGRPLYDDSFEQVVTRFQAFLARQEASTSVRAPGLHMGALIQDNNSTVSKRLTNLMRRFHRSGTVWRRIEHIIETPLFVDSSLTSMVQVADLCSYSMRRFFDYGETDLFLRIYPISDRLNGYTVGMRHYTGSARCSCQVCVDHGRQQLPTLRTSPRTSANASAFGTVLGSILPTLATAAAAPASPASTAVPAAAPTPPASSSPAAPPRAGEIGPPVSASSPTGA